jgi:hypothetical protein
MFILSAKYRGNKMTYTMAKKRATYRLDEDMLRAMKALAADRRWDVTTVVEVAVENLLKAGGYMDPSGKLTDKVPNEEDNPNG